MPLTYKTLLVFYYLVGFTLLVKLGILIMLLVQGVLVYL